MSNSPNYSTGATPLWDGIVISKALKGGGVFQLIKDTAIPTTATSLTALPTASTDVFSVIYDGTTTNYFKNGLLFFSQVKQFPGPVFVTISLDTATTLNNLIINPLSVPARTNIPMPDWTFANANNTDSLYVNSKYGLRRNKVGDALLAGGYCRNTVTPAAGTNTGVFASAYSVGIRPNDRICFGLTNVVPTTYSNGATGNTVAYGFAINYPFGTDAANPGLPEGEVRVQIIIGGSIISTALAASMGQTFISSTDALMVAYDNMYFTFYINGVVVFRSAAVTTGWTGPVYFVGLMADPAAPVTPAVIPPYESAITDIKLGTFKTSTPGAPLLMSGGKKARRVPVTPLNPRKIKNLHIKPKVGKKTFRKKRKE